jgi:hypothetical protein
MKLERLHEYILPTVATLIGMGLAAYCGMLSGNGQTSTLVSLLFGLTVAFALLILRAKIWMVIPITFTLTGQISLMPLPFAVKDIVIMTVFIAFLILKALKVVNFKPKLEMVDFWMFAMLFYLVTVYLRNPVGVDALGSDRVGGKPYFAVFIAGLAYWILSRAALAPQQVLILLAMMCLGRMSEGFLSMIAFHFPQTVPVLTEFYSTIEKQTYEASDVRAVIMGEGTNRQAYLGMIGSPLILALWSIFRPLTVINPLYIFRFIVFLLGIGCIFASGFRNMFATAIATMYLASYLRRGTTDVLRLSMLALPMIILLIAGQGTLYELPRSAQRALSFLPGRWDPISVADAQGSTEWRTMMWKAALSEDKYIKNKLLGDGFGFSQRDLAVMMANQRDDSTEAQQENMLIVGGVHSGPISAIRFVGAVGMVIFIGLLIVMAWTAWRLAKRAQGTPYLPIALFIGLPIIWEPINYVFIFGGYDGALPNAIFGVGMLKMLSYSLEAYIPQPALAAVDQSVPMRNPIWERPPIPVSAKRVAGQGS